MGKGVDDGQASSTIGLDTHYARAADVSTPKVEEIVFDTDTGVYHVGYKRERRPQGGGYVDSYETHCGGGYEVWRRPRKARVGPLNRVNARPWGENRYIPRLDRAPTNAHLCEMCSTA